jgi:photosystem II stability/assembly factor-like uncharacterized protein
MTSIPRPLVLVIVLLATAGCSAREAPAWEALPLGTTADFQDLSFADAEHGWIVGGSYQVPGGLVGRTADGGATWRFNSGLIGTPNGPDRVSVTAVHFFDSGRGLIAIGNGEILSTTDGGENWARVIRPGRGGAVSSFFFLDERRGFAVGLGGVLRTDDAGQRWTSMSTEDETGRVSGRALHFRDEVSGWLVGMHASLLHTADGGTTWDAPALPLPSGERPNLWDVCFVDREHGWVVGEGGTILATKDGGYSWSPQNSGVKDAHSAPKLERIPRAGKMDVIDVGDRTPGLTLRAVRFVDPDRGWVVGYYAGLGRSLILRTDNGGATWAVDADIPGEELQALFVQGRERLWTVGGRVREGAQAIYRRTLSAAPAVAK